MSKIEVNQISSQCGSTLTIGQSGDTVTLACGATQTGFGRTGTVDWCTTAKTAPFTGVSGNGYFVNTTCGAVTVTLPATPTAGDIISVKDYARTAATNNINFCRNGSKMDGDCASGSITTDGESTTLIYVDGTQGWTSILDSTTNTYGAAYIIATGGTITNSPCGDYKIHTFTSDSTFTVCSVGNPAGSTTVDYLVVAGAGAGGGGDRGGGGGAGGYRYASCFPVTVTSYPITVGAGAAASPPNGPPFLTPCSPSPANGSSSIFSTITSTGGGRGGVGGFTAAGPVCGHGGGNGGSGGGGGSGCGQAGPAGSGNTPPTSPSQGNNGGTGNPGNNSGGGGGGAGGVGTNAGPQNGGAGGIGSNASPIDSTYRAGGGGGNSPGYTNGTGGCGGGGSGNNTAGTVNTGGGGGGSGSGGSGIIMIKYKFQN
jgi:hypothetical protein